MSKKILIIEDDVFTTRVYKRRFKETGYEVFFASDGEEGLAKAASEKPDLILLDLLLPKKNGFDVLKELKADNKLKSIPVVVLSNLGQPADIKECKKLGAIDYLIKAGLQLETVITKIKKHLGE